MIKDYQQQNQMHISTLHQQSSQCDSQVTLNTQNNYNNKSYTNSKQKQRIDVSDVTNEISEGSRPNMKNSFESLESQNYELMQELEDITNKYRNLKKQQLIWNEITKHSNGVFGGSGGNTGSININSNSNGNSTGNNNNEMYRYLNNNRSSLINNNGTGSSSNLFSQPSAVLQYQNINPLIPLTSVQSSSSATTRLQQQLQHIKQQYISLYKQKQFLEDKVLQQKQQIEHLKYTMLQIKQLNKKHQKIHEKQMEFKQKEHEKQVEELVRRIRVLEGQLDQQSKCQCNMGNIGNMLTDHSQLQQHQQGSRYSNNNVFRQNQQNQDQFYKNQGNNEYYHQQSHQQLQIEQQYLATIQQLQEQLSHATQQIQQLQNQLHARTLQYRNQQQLTTTLQEKLEKCGEIAKEMEEYYNNEIEDKQLVISELEDRLNIVLGLENSNVTLSCGNDNDNNMSKQCMMMRSNRNKTLVDEKRQNTNKKLISSNFLLETPQQEHSHEGYQHSDNSNGSRWIERGQFSSLHSSSVVEEYQQQYHQRAHFNNIIGNVNNSNSGFKMGQNHHYGQQQSEKTNNNHKIDSYQRPTALSRSKVIKLDSNYNQNSHVSNNNNIINNLNLKTSKNIQMGSNANSRVSVSSGSCVRQLTKTNDNNNSANQLQNNYNNNANNSYSAQMAPIQTARKSFSKVNYTNPNYMMSQSTTSLNTSINTSITNTKQKTNTININKNPIRLPLNQTTHNY